MPILRELIERFVREHTQRQPCPGAWRRARRDLIRRELREWNARGETHLDSIVRQMAVALAKFDGPGIECVSADALTSMEREFELVRRLRATRAIFAASERLLQFVPSPLKARAAQLGLDLQELCASGTAALMAKMLRDADVPGFGWSDGLWSVREQVQYLTTAYGRTRESAGYGITPRLARPTMAQWEQFAGHREIYADAKVSGLVALIFEFVRLVGPHGLRRADPRKVLGELTETATRKLSGIRNEALKLDVARFLMVASQGAVTLDDGLMDRLRHCDPEQIILALEAEELVAQVATDAVPGDEWTIPLTAQEICEITGHEDRRTALKELRGSDAAAVMKSGRYRYTVNVACIPAQYRGAFGRVRNAPGRAWTSMDEHGSAKQPKSPPQAGRDPLSRWHDRATPTRR